MDKKLRDIERAWLADIENQELLRKYWKACLRADKVPMANWQFGQPRGNGDIHWFLGDSHPSSYLTGDYEDRRVAYRNLGDHDRRVWLPGEIIQHNYDLTVAQAEKRIKLGLRMLLDEAS